MALNVIDTRSEEQKRLMEQLSKFAESRVGKGLPAWEGDFTVPYSKDEQYGLGRYRESIEAVDPDKTRDWYMKYIAPGEKRYFDEEIIPGIKESMVSGGTLRSTGTERAIGGAYEGFGTGQLNRIGQTIQMEKDRATGALPGYMAAASMPRMIEQEELNREIQEFMRTTPELNPILGVVMQLLQISTKAAMYQPESSMWGDFLGAAGKGLGSYLGSRSTNRDTNKTTTDPEK